ncbi:hypothetical protein F5878DRAFT_660723 [Lentinula raphanica]|uniref:Uncharacterized protein n=1 Tax=Lentinula raphanica TaxID=153919 RepID=A0AA38P9T0_9AGAR|nr:hypothetical protein F5878DRAFT_660723 [Lentinula raphanica]
MSLDKLYDFEKARTSLEMIQKERRKDRKNHIQISDIGKKKGWEANMKVEEFYQPHCWRLVWSDGSDVPHEVVFHMQGVVEGKSLPPFRKSAGSKQKNKIRHTRQWVTISGLGNEAFAKDREGIMEVYALFARIANGLGAIDFKSVNERDAVELGNRLFTPKGEAPGMEWADVEDDVDSTGFIQWVKKNDMGLTYGEENVVRYGEEYTKVTNENGTPVEKKRTADMIPQKFHVGDIVDVGFTIIGVESGRTSPPKAKLLLRTITLVDSSHAQEWIKAKAKTQVMGGQVRKVQMGKREFDDDDVEGTRKRFQHLSTNDEDE